VVAAVANDEVAAERVRARRRGRLRAILLVLDGISDPGNLGTILRSALAADVDEALLAPGCADPLAPKVVRAASGAHFHLPVRADQSWQEIAAVLGGSPAFQQVLVAEAGAHTPYDAVDLTQRTAVLIGNEAHGVSPQGARMATQRVRIPMWNKVESLNAAIAASVVLFEAARQRRALEQEKMRDGAGDER
jgi:TrmH family RNA methyltransferase